MCFYEAQVFERVLFVPPVASAMSVTNRSHATGGLRFTTGFDELDHQLGGGLQPDQVTLIAGIAGSGTSVFALGLGRFTAHIRNRAAVVIAPDQSEIEVHLRITAATAPVAIDRLRVRDLSPADDDRLRTMRSALTMSSLHVDAGWTEPITDKTLLASIRHWLDEGASFIVVDAPASATGTPAFFPEIQRMAERDVAAIVVTAKAHPPADRHDAPPCLSDVDIWSQARAHTGTVLSLHRVDMLGDVTPRPGEADVEILHGGTDVTGRVVVCFQSHFVRFIGRA